MREQALLLNDEAMRHFVRHGYIAVQAELPPGFHEAMCARLDEVIATEGNPGNNILPRVPEIQQVFDHAAVHGALTSVLGPNYAMHPHRYAHCNLPGSKAQTLHKDSTHYSGDMDIRDHCCRWAMCFYYPQDVTEDMGPTSILPGTQYYETLSNDPDNAELLLCGKAGTVTIVHFDVWHRATANVSDKRRYMLKFLFARMEEPRAPSWDAQTRDAQSPAWLLPEESASDEKHALLWRYHWNWLHGEAHQGVREAPAATGHAVSEWVSPNTQRPTPNACMEVATGHAVAEWVALLQGGDTGLRRHAADALGLLGPQAEGAIPALTAALDDAVETVGLNATYALGAIGAPAIPALADALRKDSAAARHHASIALGVIGRPAVPTLIQAAQAEDWHVRAAAVDTLAEVETPSSEVISTLIHALGDEADWVRRHAADTLGNIGSAAGAATLSLANLLQDKKPYVRINAATALGKLGPAAEDAVPALTEALLDPDRYTRGFAALALQRIGTTEAHAALLNVLMTTRWCPITSAKTPY